MIENETSVLEDGPLCDFNCPRYSVLRSPGDGHCFIHSVVQSHNSQNPHAKRLTNTDLIKLLTDETLNNTDTYLPFMENKDINVLMTGLNDYVVNKHYDTSFGDLVPGIFSNAMSINILIITKTVTGHMKQLIECRSDSDTFNISVYKTGDHYDVIVVKWYEASRKLCKPICFLFARDTYYTSYVV